MDRRDSKGGSESETDGVRGREVVAITSPQYLEETRLKGESNGVSMSGRSGPWVGSFSTPIMLR